MKITSFILISVLCFGCTTFKCPPSSVDPSRVYFPFSIVDKNGNNLFFGKDSIYNPYDVKFAVGQENIFPQSWFQINEDGKCFILGGFYQTDTPYTFYIKLLPDNIDTIKIESQSTGWYEEPEGCRHFPVYKDDVFFNNVPICTDCDKDTILIYKIELK